MLKSIGIDIDESTPFCCLIRIIRNNIENVVIIQITDYKYFVKICIITIYILWMVIYTSLVGSFHRVSHSSRVLSY